MKSFHLLLKKIAITIIENLIKIFWLLPLKQNRILFISYTGAYSDSPKYLYKKIKEISSEVECIWAVNEKSFYENEILTCHKVHFGSISYIKTICTSSMVITNNFLSTYIPRRKGQYIVNTWHGGSPLKTVGMVNKIVDPLDKFFYEHHARKYNLYLSSSEFMTKEVFQKSFAYSGKIFNCGLPRNSILYKNNSESKKNVSKYFTIPIDVENGVILYAPTFRGNASNASFISDKQLFDIEKVLDVCERRFKKKYKLLFRAHYFNDKKKSTKYISATHYPDMQELLAASDILITDYSSCMGDMCLTRKPVFLYTPDLEEYISDRGFYWNIFTLPFPVAQNAEKFYDIILNFDEEQYQEKVIKYLQRLYSYEAPGSDEVAARYLLKLLMKDNVNEK